MQNDDFIWDKDEDDASRDAIENSMEFEDDMDFE